MREHEMVAALVAKGYTVEAPPEPPPERRTFLVTLDIKGDNRSAISAGGVEHLIAAGLSLRDGGDEWRHAWRGRVHEVKVQP